MIPTPPSGSGDRPGKRVTKQAEIGQLGVNLIEQIVLKMGSAWHPTNPSLDAGIDGEIELVDPSTREATNAVLRVQSKATMLPFPGETDEGFEWSCDERDLRYWLSGNAPVLLIVSRPHLSEAYWVSVKDYFSTPEHQHARRVHFNKKTMRFSPASREQLFGLAVPRDTGIYFAPRPRPETLFANLLKVSALPPRLWLAETALRSGAEVVAKLRERSVEKPAFTARDKRILSAHNLTEPEWSDIVDRGTVEEFAVGDWADATEKDLLGRFVELLNHCLTARCRRIGCVRHKDDGMYYFAATADLSPRVQPYRSVKEITNRAVFASYRFEAGDRAGQVSFYRHSAFFGQFRRYDGQWFLQIDPSYYFSIDGQRRHPHYEGKLKGIKALEKNATLLGQVVMWASLLRTRDGGSDDNHVTGDDLFLKFGELAEFTLEVGIDDSAWLPNEDKGTAAAVKKTLDDLPLFQQDQIARGLDGEGGAAQSGPPS